MIHRDDTYAYSFGVFFLPLNRNFLAAEMTTQGNNF